jgi:hypothetical protein
MALVPTVLLDLEVQERCRKFCIRVSILEHYFPSFPIEVIVINSCHKAYLNFSLFSYLIMR